MNQRECLSQRRSCLLWFGLLALFAMITNAAASGAVRLHFVVEDAQWQLLSATETAEQFNDRRNQAGDLFASIYSPDGRLLQLIPLGRPGLRFYDYADENGELAGLVTESDDFHLSFRIPSLESDYRLTISDSDGGSLFETSGEAIRSFLAIKLDEYPIFALDTLTYNGDPEERIDIIILGDGYILQDTTVFLDHCNMHVNYTSSVPPFDYYWERFNIYAVTTISNQRGADHPEWGVYKDTYYNSEYWGRLIGMDYGIAAGVADEHVPVWDEMWMLVQDPTYGGSGSPQIAISYSASTQVLTHEFGHSFGLLWDEYSYGGSGSVVGAPNCDENSVNPKWQYWIDSLYPDVGTFMPCTYDNAYRPTWNGCMMKALMDVFCIVCIEQIINRVYDYAPNPISFTAPESDFVLGYGQGQLFEFEYANSDNFPMVIGWFLDGEEQVDSTGTSFYFAPADTGSYELTVTLEDTTALVLNLPDSAMTTVHTWYVDYREIICGDVNGDLTVNVSDVVYMISYVFGDGPPPEPLLTGDVDCNELINVSDIVYLIAFVFGDGPEPCAECPQRMQ
jgi:hypothetical protein